VPEFSSELQAINDRVVDLMTPFSKQWYVDANFKGSASIKSVLPVLVPSLSYKKLNIQEGATAQRQWMETVLDNKNRSTKNQIFADLLTYCKLDTLAMVKIYKYLKNL
jgi:hypothetical protein